MRNFKEKLSESVVNLKFSLEVVFLKLHQIK